VQEHAPRDHAQNLRRRHCGPRGLRALRTGTRTVRRPARAAWCRSIEARRIAANHGLAQREGWCARRGRRAGCRCNACTFDLDTAIRHELRPCRETAHQRCFVFLRNAMRFSSRAPAATLAGISGSR
jgi:hypothetical protein